MPKLTIHDLFKAKKEGRQLVEIRTDDVNEAIACAEAGVQMIMCMKEYLPIIRAAVPDVFIISANKLDQPHIASPDQAIAAGFELMNLGADAVYSGMSMKVVEAMANEYIPVIGHIGFVPYRSTWIGGARAVGKTAVEAVTVYEAAKAYRDAGAIGAEIEIVPARVTEEIGKRLENFILASMGSGTGGTVQYLFATDILGTNTGHIPRHAKVYGEIGKEEARLQKLRIQAFKALCDDVSSGGYPEDKHLLKMKDDEFEDFIKYLPEE